MNKDVQETAKIMLSQIAMGRDYSQIKDYNSLFMDAENIVSSMAFLLGPLMDAETAYRQKIVEFMELGDSHAKSEAKAKATEHYKEYKKLQYAYELGQEQVMLIKKFSDKIQLEERNSSGIKPLQ